MNACVHSCDLRHSEGGVVVNVDRFDLGRDVGDCLQPTALIPGDVIIYCTVRTPLSVL